VAHLLVRPGPVMGLLQPCPFCGSTIDAKVIRNHIFPLRQHCDVSSEFTNCVVCSCGAQGPEKSAEADAIHAWNRRP